MNLVSLRNLAAAGVIALGFAAAAGPAFAAAPVFDPTTPRVAAGPDDWEAGVAYELGVFATVANTFSVTTTDINFDEIGATSMTGQVGELEITPAGAYDVSALLTAGANTGGARITQGTNGSETQGILDIAGAFIQTDIYLTYGTVTDLSCALCTTTPPDLLIVQLRDDMAGTAGRWDFDTPANNLQGVAETAAVTGDLTINIGAMLRTEDTDTPYESGLYAGSVEITLEY